MSQYRYSPLLSGNNSIRLLRLMPHEDETANIQCELFEYSLRNNSSKEIHLYDALSYVWGNPDEKLPIFIRDHSFDVTVNLRAALLRLRNHSLERILWVDAICINQGNQEEKGHQIQCMAQIYGKANRVIVWLGEAADDSDLAFEEICVAGRRGNKSTNCLDSKSVQQAVLALLQRPWFRRIWILQEVAAARHVLIMCGSMKIDGYIFCLGVDSFKFYNARQDLQGLIRPVTYLIREAIFRPDYLTGSSGRLSLDSSGRSSLDICPLGELIDMYHAHESTKRHDKVYALLGMSSDDLSRVNLLPNYEVPWEKLLQRLAKYLLSKEISVETWCNREIAVIKSKGCILGQVSLVQNNMAQENRQGVDVTFKNIPGQPRWSAQWTLQVSAKPIQNGDIICLLRGVSKPTIIRLCKDYFAIIMIAATPPEKIQTGEKEYMKWQELLLLANIFTRDLLLVWDWESSLEKLQDQERYETLINNAVLEHSKTELGSHLDKATRTWNVALVLEDVGEHKKAEEKLRDAVNRYKIAFREVDSCMLDSKYVYTPLVWAAGNGYIGVVNLLLAKDGIDIDLKDSDGRTPLQVATERGHKAVVKLLLNTGKVDVNLKDSFGQTPLHLATERGHKAVIKLLLNTGKTNVNLGDSFGQTPLLLAAEKGCKAVVKLLLETGKVNVNLKNSHGQTPLWLAAEKGNEAVVKLLLKMSKVNVDLKDSRGQTPLQVATERGHEVIVKLLLDTDKVNVNLRDSFGQTPLLLAAEQGYKAVVKLLLETGKVDVNLKDSYGQTPLLWAAEGGHEAVVKLLLETGKVNVDLKDSYGQTPLLWAAEGGHEAVVKLLLETGKVDVNLKDSYGQTPLLWAAEGGHEAVVKLLLETGKVDVDLKDSRGQTPLSRAAEGGHEAVVKPLLETGKVDVNSKDSRGRTSLCWAVEQGHETIVKLLLETGKVNVDSKDSRGRTPLSRAAKKGHKAVVKLLEP